MSCLCGLFIYYLPVDNCVLRAEQIFLPLVVNSAAAESGPCSTHCFHGRKQAAQYGFGYFTFSSEFNWED